MVWALRWQFTNWLWDAEQPLRSVLPSPVSYGLVVNLSCPYAGRVHSRRLEASVRCLRVRLCTLLQQQHQQRRLGQFRARSQRTFRPYWSRAAILVLIFACTTLVICFTEWLCDVLLRSSISIQRIIGQNIFWGVTRPWLRGHVCTL